MLNNNNKMINGTIIKERFKAKNKMDLKMKKYIKQMSLIT